jgi:hypothetical protein
MLGCSGWKGKLAVLYKTLMYIVPSDIQLYITYMHFILGCEKIRIHTFLRSGYLHLPGQTRRYPLPFHFNGEVNNQITSVKNLHACQCTHFISLTELFIATRVYNYIIYSSMYLNSFVSSELTQSLLAIA